MSVELKPCPFCGESAVLEADFSREWWVQCTYGHSDGIIYKSPQEAESAWNTRFTTADGLPLPQASEDR